MVHQRRLLVCAVQAGLACAAEKTAQVLHLDFFYNWTAKTWEYYQLASREQRILELGEIAPKSFEQVYDEAASIAAEAGLGVPIEVKQQVVELVSQIPGTIRDALRRPDDPLGKSVPRSFCVESDADLQRLLPRSILTRGRWDVDRMKSKLAASGATTCELDAIDAILAWASLAGECVFQSAGTPSAVIQIPTCGLKVNLLTLQGRRIRFYWGHFIGGYDETMKANIKCKKFPHAYELAETYCTLLNKSFGWNLQVLSDSGGFREPSRPLTDICQPKTRDQFLNILSRIAADALFPRMTS